MKSLPILKSRYLAISLWGLAAIVFIFLILISLLNKRNTRETIEFTSLTLNILIYTFIILSTLMALDTYMVLGQTIKRYLRQKGEEFQETILPDFQALPVELIEWATELKALGFEELGSYQITYLENSDFNSTAWVLLDESTMVYVELVQRKNGIQFLIFSTDYPNSFSLWTGFNILLEYDTPYLHANTVNQSINAAYDYHLTQKRLFDKTHVQAKQISAIADIFLSADDLRTRQRSMELMIAKKYGVIIAGYLSYTFIALSSLVVAKFWGSIPATIFLSGLMGFVAWNIDFNKSKVTFQSVEERKPRKTSS